MGVTFTVPGADPKVSRICLPCPKCGAVLSGEHGDPGCDYDDGTGTPCGGYGPSPPSLRPENTQYSMNVSRASVILYGLLNYGSAEKPLDYGELDPSDVLIRLALANYRISTLIEAPSEWQGERVVITSEGVSVQKTARAFNGGMTQERLERYVETLTKFAHKAVELGVMIQYA